MCLCLFTRSLEGLGGRIAGGGKKGVVTLGGLILFYFIIHFSIFFWVWF